MSVEWRYLPEVSLSRPFRPAKQLGRVDVVQACNLGDDTVLKLGDQVAMAAPHNL